jgi:hypothetical protein
VLLAALAHERTLSDCEPLGDEPHAPAFSAVREALVLCISVIRNCPARYATGTDRATRHFLRGLRQKDNERFYG